MVRLTLQEARVQSSEPASGSCVFGILHLPSTQYTREGDDEVSNDRFPCKCTQVRHDLKYHVVLMHTLIWLWNLRLSWDTYQEMTNQLLPLLPEHVPSTYCFIGISIVSCWDFWICVTGNSCLFVFFFTDYAVEELHNFSSQIKNLRLQKEYHLLK